MEFSSEKIRLCSNKVLLYIHRVRLFLQIQDEAKELEDYERLEDAQKIQQEAVLETRKNIYALSKSFQRVRDFLMIGQLTFFQKSSSFGERDANVKASLNPCVNSIFFYPEQNGMVKTTV
jgi:hypothetical protein